MSARRILGSKRRVRGEGQKRISEKIPVLMKEGKSQKAAIGEAYGMERAGRLRRGGVYIPKGKK